MRPIHRKTTPKVSGGAVLRKNNHKNTPNHWNTAQEEVIIDVEKPGKGFKHFLKKKDIRQFISLIPDWDQLSEGLDAIVLTAADGDSDGYYNNDGVICIAAWEKEQDVLLTKQYYQDHEALFQKLGVKTKTVKEGIHCAFTVDQIKAFQLLHILLHELGHHYDRMKTKSQHKSSRGENYAEQFAFDHEAQLWIAYQEVFQVVF